jgi:Zn-dependent peptidase ImmA (M78 family)
MGQIAARLRLPLRFFMQKHAPDVDSLIFWRSASTATKPARTRVRRRLKWLRSIATYLREYVEFPPIDLPDLPDLPTEPLAISQEYIERSAISVRQHWSLGDGPLGSIVTLLENNGVVVARDDFQADGLDALSEIHPHDPLHCVLLGSGKDSMARSRMDACHELGHLLLHRRIDRMRITNSTELNTLEKQANRFAGAFTLPADAFSADLSSLTLDSFAVLKAKWQMSIGVMIKRCEDLDFLGEGQARNLWRSYASRGWRTDEPLDNELPIERPEVLAQSFELILSENIQTRDQVLTRCPYDVRDIEELSALEPGFLMGARTPKVRVIPFRQKEEAPAVPTDGIRSPLIDFDSIRQRK